MPARADFRFLHVIFAALAAAEALPASGVAERHGWWGTLDLGYGMIERSLDGVNFDESKFYFGVGIGHAVTPNLLVGMELNVWTFETTNAHSPWYDEPDDEPPKGEAVVQYLVVARLYPTRESNLMPRSAPAMGAIGTSARASGTATECAPRSARVTTSSSATLGPSHRESPTVSGRSATRITTP